MQTAVKSQSARVQALTQADMVRQDIERILRRGTYDLDTDGLYRTYPLTIGGVPYFAKVIQDGPECVVQLWANDPADFGPGKYRAVYVDPFGDCSTQLDGGEVTRYAQKYNAAVAAIMAQRTEGQARQ
jgi:hypothetical protein